MAINVISVQYNGGFLPDNTLLMLTQGYYRRETHFKCCCCCCCLHIKNRSDLYPVPFSFLLFKAKKRISVVSNVMEEVLYL